MPQLAWRTAYDTRRKAGASLINLQLDVVVFRRFHRHKLIHRRLMGYERFTTGEKVSTRVTAVAKYCMLTRLQCFVDVLCSSNVRVSSPSKRVMTDCERYLHLLKDNTAHVDFRVRTTPSLSSHLICPLAFITPTPASEYLDVLDVAAMVTRTGGN